MKKFLVYLVAFMFVLSMGGTAFAAWSTGSTLKNVMVTANPSYLQAVGTTTNPLYNIVAAEVLGLNDTITLTLTGGATFSGVAGLTLQPGLTVDLGAGAAAAAGPISGGTAGSTTATWRVVVGGGAVANSYVVNLMTISNINLTAVPAAGNVDLQMTMATATGIPILTARSVRTDTGNYLFTGAASETVNLTQAAAVADVLATTGPFTKFEGAATTATAVLSFTNNSTATTVPISSDVSAGKILFSITGDFTGITSVRGTGCTGSNSLGVTTGGLSDYFLIGSGTAYCVNTLAVAGAGAAARALAPRLTVNGTTAQTARNFTAGVNVLLDTVWSAHTATITPAAAADPYLFKITKNGQSAYLYNIPSPDNTNSAAIVRVTNNGTVAGKIYGTLTLNNGTAYTGTLITSLAAGATQQLTSTEIGTALAPGVVWTGTRARLFISSETSAMRVQGTVQQALSTGYNNTNFSTIAPTTE